MRLPVELAGAALREILPWLHRLADAMDPCATAPGWTSPPKPANPVCPDTVPDALLVRW